MLTDPETIGQLLDILEKKFKTYGYISNKIIERNESISVDRYGHFGIMPFNEVVSAE